MNLPNIAERCDAVMLSRCKTHRAHTNRSSSLGDECERRLVYARTIGEQMQIDVGLAYVFQMGNILEEPTLRLITDAGYKIEQHQRDFVYPQTGKVLVTGHIDCIISDGAESYVADVKTCSPFVWEKLPTDIVSAAPFNEFSRYDYMRKYPAQLQLYMFGLEIPQGLFIFVNKNSGRLKIIGMELDYEYTEDILQKAARINEHVENQTLPERTVDDDVCDRCGYRDGCCPGMAGKVIEYGDDELAAMVTNMHELKAAKKECEELEDEIKAAVAGKEILIAGDWQYRGKWIDVQRKATVASTSKQWRGKWEKL